MSYSATAVRRVLVPLDIGGPPLAPFGAQTSLATLGGPTMGTTWRVQALVAHAGLPPALQAAIDRLLDDLIAALSNWERGSALSRFNRSPVDTWQHLPPSLIDVLVAARDTHEASGGAFDPTVARAVSAWGFGPVDTADGSSIGYAAIEIDAEGGRARRRDDVVLDLCGIAKGYAVDRVSQWLTARGAPHHLVEIGGELRGNGVKADGLPWWVALEAPPDLDIEATPTVAALHGLSIATSGDYRRHAVRDGRRIAHTIDPTTGRPVVDALASVTVLHATCMTADAEATAITVLGPVAGLAYATARGLAARLIERTADGATVRCTPAFDAMLA